MTIDTFRASRHVAALSLLPFLIGAAGPAPAQSTATAAATTAAVPDSAARAQRLAQQHLLVDTHIDVPYRLLEDPEDISRRTRRGDFDFERARAGGLDVAFLSIYIPADYQKGGAKLFADGLIDLAEGLAKHNPDRFAMVRSAAEAEAIATSGKVGLAMGMENGAPIENDLANLRHFHARGIRYVTLTHGEDNQICDSSYSPADKRTWKGLSPFGREVVAEMNRLGVMIDISHVSDATFDQVIALSKAPLIASHSSARAFTPGFERNLDDQRIKALAARGGVLQINFGSAFLTAAANTHSREDWEARAVWVKERTVATGQAPSGEETEEFVAERRRKNPLPYASLKDVADHIDHVRQIAGVDAVGIGSDFDGVGDSLPAGLKDVSSYPNLVAELLARGYSEPDIAKILGGNLIRVWKAVEAVAAGSAP